MPKLRGDKAEVLPETSMTRGQGCLKVRKEAMSLLCISVWNQHEEEDSISNSYDGLAIGNEIVWGWLPMGNQQDLNFSLV